MSDRILVLGRNPGRIKEEIVVPDNIRQTLPFHAREQEGYHELFHKIWKELDTDEDWWSAFLDKVLEPYLVVLNSMPKVALGPLLIVGLGPGFLSIMAMAIAITVIITTIVIYTQFKEVDPNYIKVIRTFGGSKTEVFKKVILPASFPTIVSTLKVNVGLAWVGVIVGEFLVAKSGLGYLIIYGFQVFNFTLVYLASRKCMKWQLKMYHLPNLP